MRRRAHREREPSAGHDVRGDRAARGRAHRVHGAWTLLLLPLCGACATLDGGPRAARGSADCARAAVAEVVSPGMHDKRAHCHGVARIAVRCSVAEARLAGWGKEVADAFGGGDPDWSDLAADRAGIACARARAPDVAACCAAAGY